MPKLPVRNLAHVRTRKEEDYWQFGAFAEVSVKFDLDDQDRWFAELWGRYHWVDSFTVQDAFTEAEIDPSSWSVGLGVGVRF
ncbi:MAG: hypothetical protein R3F11_14900 [Verrucomicrobiales bacterium]